MKKIIIVGGGGHARVIIDILLKIPDVEIIGITEVRKELHGTFLLDIPVRGDDSILPQLLKKEDTSAIIGVGSIGDTALRAKLFEEVKAMGFTFINVIHPYSCINSRVVLGEGNVIMAGAIINPDVVIGNNTIINTGVIIEHDCIIEDNTHISLGVKLGGGIKIGKNSHIGIGATIIQGINVGKNVIVGAGSVVIRDIPDNTTVVGVPAKIIKRR